MYFKETCEKISTTVAHYYIWRDYNPALFPHSITHKVERMTLSTLGFVLSLSACITPQFPSATLLENAQTIWHSKLSCCSEEIAASQPQNPLRFSCKIMQQNRITWNQIEICGDVTVSIWYRRSNLFSLCTQGGKWYQCHKVYDREPGALGRLLIRSQGASTQSSRLVEQLEPQCVLDAWRRYNWKLITGFNTFY